MGQYAFANKFALGFLGQSAGPRLVRAGLFGLVYFAGAELGHFLSVGGYDQVIATLWPPAGLFLATLFLENRRNWPMLVLVAWAAEFASNVLLHDKSWAVSLGFSLSNSLEACTGAWLLRRLYPETLEAGFSLRRLKDVTKWVLLSALPSTILGATVGAVVVTMAFTESYWSTWFVWWVGNFLGVLVVAPLVLDLAGEDPFVPQPRVGTARPSRLIEGVILFCGLVLVAGAVFGNLLAMPLAQPILILPFVLWAGLRFGTRTSAAALLVLTVVAMWHTSQGRGPFHIEGASLSEQALRGQTFLSVVSFCALLLAATVAERRQAQMALEESETFLRLAQKAGCIGSWQWDVGTNRIQWSDEFARMHGITRAEFDGTLATVIDFCHPDDRARLQDAITRVLRGGEVRENVYETRIRRRDGAERCFWHLGHAYRNIFGKASKLIGVAIDITDRKHAEETLRQSEERYRVLTEHARVVLWECDPNTFTFTHVSEFAEPLLGIKREEWYAPGFWAAHVHPDDREEAVVYCLRCTQAKQDHRFEYRMVRADGQFVWVEDVVTVVVENGSVACLRGALIDVSERKRADEALRLSEERYRLIVENQTEFIVKWLPDGTRTFVNESYCRCFGLTEDQCVGTSFLPLVAPDFRAAIQRKISSITPDKPEVTDEHLSLVAGGEKRWQQWTDRGTFDAQGKLIEVLSTGRDISERKRVEEALRESEEKFRSAFAFAAIGMALVRLDGRWRQVNQRLCEIVGYSEEELLARNFQSITHPDDLDTDLGFVQQMLDGSIPYYHMEKRYFHKQGNIVWIYLSVSLVRDAQRQPLYFIGQIQDITQRKQTEDTLHRYNHRLKALSHQILETQETERRRIARELHDEVGQMLTTIGLRLHQLKAVCGAEVQAALNEDITFVNRTIEQVRELSLNLRPPMLDVLGLEAALRWYAENQSERTGLNVQLVGHLEGPRLDPDLEIVCFRVVQEALTNIVRHARAKRVWVKLQVEEPELHLIVRDDGIGLDVAAAQERAGRGRSFGILAMQERVELLGGRFEVESTPGAGTRIRARFPLARTSEDRSHVSGGQIVDFTL
jgi:two-component system sensor histidine kinase UhpB